MSRVIGAATLLYPLSMIALAGAVDAKAPATPRPEIFTKLVECRKIVDDAARLACFDTQVAKLDEAETAQNIVIVDKAQVKQAKRGLFGLNLPNFTIFGGSDDEKAADGSKENDAIETVIKSAYVNNMGKLTIIIDDGAKWVQIDQRDVRTPKPGQSVRIRRASLGSFFANINGQVAIRMRREN